MARKSQTSVRSNLWESVGEFLLEVKNTPSGPTVRPNAPPWTLATKMLLRNCIFFLIAFAIHHAYYRGTGGEMARAVLLVMMANSGSSEGYDLDWANRLRLLVASASTVAIVGLVHGFKPLELSLWIAVSPVLNIVPWILWDLVKKRRG